MFNAELRDDFLRRAARDDRGTIAVVWALMFTVVLATVGGAVDFLRWRDAKQTTMTALESAVLAGALELQANPQNPHAAEDKARAAYAANTVKRGTVKFDNITFTAGADGQSIGSSGTASIATAVLSVIGLPDLALTNAAGGDMPRAEIVAGGPGGSNLEVAAILDITGSMCNDGNGPCTTGTKIDALKAAATKLVNIVVRADQSNHTSKVALIPFSTRVRLAPDDSAAALMKTLTNLDSPRDEWYQSCTSSSGGGGSETSIPWTCNGPYASQGLAWHAMPCVTERFIGGVFDVSDDPPGPGKWLTAHDGSRHPLSDDSRDAAFTGGRGTSATDLAADWNYSPNPGDCADIYAGSEIVPLTSDKAALLAHINSLQAYGGTAGALATSWGWYMLSPNWNTVWTGASTPAPYAEITTPNANGAPTLRKVAILMTDGGFNVLRSQKSQPQQTVSDDAIAVCTAMKAKGIEIYTVGFMLNTLSATEAGIARTTLQACGTDVQHFYDSLTAADLETAFHVIGVKLSGIKMK